MSNKLKLLKRQQIDDDRWNMTMRSSKMFRHYNLTYFLDSCTDHWSALVNDDYSALWPLPEKKLPIKRQYQPLLAQQQGPTFLNEIDDSFLQNGLQFLNETYPSWNVKFNDAISFTNVKSLTEHFNVELSLDAPYVELRKNYNRNIKSNLKKAEKAELKVGEEDQSFPFVIDAFKNSQRSEIKELGHRFYKDVEEIYQAFLKREEAKCLIASIRNEPVAGAMLLVSASRLLLFFTATTSKARGLGAMHYIIDHVIKTYSDKPIILDFEGSNDENLRFFYRSFGGEEKVYLQLKNNRMAWPLNKVIK